MLRKRSIFFGPGERLQLELTRVEEAFLAASGSAQPFGSQTLS